MKNYPHIAIQVPQILLPKAGTDLTKWAVIACDQFTSEPEYWRQVEQIVGDAPSTYNLVLPEVFLGTPQETARIQATRQAMQNYLNENLLQARDGFVLVERTMGGKTRRGLMLALDLEQYDFTPGSQSLIRATEGTILERLPPRIKIRQGAPLELPHILVLIDDPHCTVIEPLLEKRNALQPLYDFELMLGSGHLAGWLVAQPDLQAQVTGALAKLADPLDFSSRYGVDAGSGVLLFAMGDGNHSLATAKAIWEKMRAQAGPDHPSRYALVEIENVHDDGLSFEPIHRVLFDVKEDLQAAMQRHFGSDGKLYALRQTGRNDRPGNLTGQNAASRRGHFCGGLRGCDLQPPNFQFTRRHFTAFPRQLAASRARPAKSTTSTVTKLCTNWALNQATWPFTCRPWRKKTCSRRSFWMACCPEKLFQWEKPKKNASIWKRGASIEVSF